MSDRNRSSRVSCSLVILSFLVGRDSTCSDSFEEVGSSLISSNVRFLSMIRLESLK